jgi:hypothetical protein
MGEAKRANFVGCTFPNCHAGSRLLNPPGARTLCAWPTTNLSPMSIRRARPGAAPFAAPRMRLSVSARPA